MADTFFRVPENLSQTRLKREEARERKEVNATPTNLLISYFPKTHWPASLYF